MRRNRKATREDNAAVPKNAPLFALGSAVLLMAGGVLVVVTGNGGKNDGSLLVGLVVTTIPSVIAAAFAERASRDVRNGTVTEKARLGARKAIDEANVVRSDGPVVQHALTAQAASTAALTALLERVMPAVEHNTDVTEAVADALEVEHKERTPHAPQQP